MTVIFSNLLLDLPLFQHHEGRWPDKSGHGNHAVNTSASDLESKAVSKLGRGLQLMPGNQLSLSGAALTDKEKLTVEFWALPDQGAKSGYKQLLSGPVSVEMGKSAQQFKLAWKFGSSPAHKIVLNLDDVPEFQSESDIDPTPHHWAIVANFAKSERPFTVYRDGVGIDVVPTKVGKTTKDLEFLSDSNAASSTTLYIGSDKETGWFGFLAHLRIWADELTAKELQANGLRDITAHAAFKASTSIEWQLLNDHDEPSLYIHSRQAQVLKFEVRNVSEKMKLSIEKPKEDSKELSLASKTRYHLKLAFRAGTLSKHFQGSTTAIQDANSGWKTHLETVGEEDCVFFLWAGKEDKTIEQGEFISLKLPNIDVAPGSGSRTTRVLFQYQEIGVLVGSQQKAMPEKMSGHRSQLLNIIYREPTAAYRKPPLEVGVVGAPVILNNGTETTLKLYIKNIKRDEDQNSDKLEFGSAKLQGDKQPKFILEIDLKRRSDINLVETPFRALEEGDIYFDQSDYFKVNWKFLKVDFKKAVYGIVGTYKPRANDGGVVTIVHKGEGEYEWETQEGLRWNLFGHPDNSYRVGTNCPYYDEGYHFMQVAYKNSEIASVKGPKDLWYDSESSSDTTIFSVTRLSTGENIYIGSSDKDISKLAQTFGEFGSGFGDLDDIYNISIENESIKVGDPQALPSLLRWKIVPPQLQDEPDKPYGLKKDQIITLTLTGLKSTAPPGWSNLRVKYEDFEQYGEGVFEIPIERASTIPYKLSGDGAGYGLAIGHDPRFKKGPNSEMVSLIKPSGDGDAIHIENNEKGIALNVSQNGSGRSAKLSGGSGVEIEGKVRISEGNDVKKEDEDSGYLLIGNSSGKHIAIDDNAIMAKSSGTIAGVLSCGSKVRISGGNDVNQNVKDSGYLLIGDTSGEHIAIDDNEIMAKANGTSTATLHLQAQGGTTECRGKVRITGGNDVKKEEEDSGYLLIGNSSGKHIAIDDDVIMAKANGTSTATLYLQARGGKTTCGGGLYVHGATACGGLLECVGDLDVKGKIGLQVRKPIKGILEIGKSKDFLPDGLSVGSFDLGKTTPLPSVWADGYLVAQGILELSDKRIKNIIGCSNSLEDLESLLAIEVTDYTYIDTLGKGNGIYKKVVAQQLEQVYPQAVTQQAGSIPDIYQLAPCEGDWITLVTDLKPGDRINLISENAPETTQEVLEVTQDKFRVDCQLEGQQVFVYGREVDDFRVVDYDAIAMLNVSATQQIKKELDAEVKSLREENTRLLSQLSALEKRVAKCEIKDQERETRLAMIESQLTLNHQNTKPIQASSNGHYSGKP